MERLGHLVSWLALLAVPIAALLAVAGRLPQPIGHLGAIGDVFLIIVAIVFAHSIDVRNNSLVADGFFEIKPEQAILRGNRLELIDTGVIVISNGSITRHENVIYFERYAFP
jgi:hypothetical protein